MGAVLSEEEIEGFVRDGFVHLDQAFPSDLAGRCVEELWSQLGVDRDDPSSWTQPVVRIPGSAHPDLVAAINAPRLVGAIDDLLGPRAWQRRAGYGTFPVRFPSDIDPGDTGWHVDGSFGDPPWYRVNLASRGRALLLLMLFTDVTERDAPTRIKRGSHHDVARALVDLPADGVALLPAEHAPASLEHPVDLATGHAGDVYLCHPFLVHAASWPHRGDRPRMLGQPCIHHPEGEWLGGFAYDEPADHSAVARAVRQAIGRG
jgi:Phytanoyl-CoA dioxygenase (PhyH)